MMQAADFWSDDDRAHLGPLDGSHVGRVLLEREMSSRAVIVDEVAGQDAAQVPLAEHKDMVQTLTANRPRRGSATGCGAPSGSRRSPCPSLSVRTSVRRSYRDRGGGR